LFAGIAYPFQRLNTFLIVEFKVIMVLGLFLRLV
jgi:hypothetical protein